MTKPELVRNIVNKFEVKESEAAYFVGNIFTAMSEALIKGKNINIPEFGKFKIVYRIIDGSRKRTVVFSPVRKFADSVNEDYNNLESHITKVFKLKNSDVLTVRELMPDENDEDYLCFIFDDKPVAEISPEISSEEILEYNIPKQSVSEDLSDKTFDNEKAFELPETRRKIVHNLKDDFSIYDIDITDFIIDKEKILNEIILTDTLPHDKNTNISFPITETAEDDIIISSKTDDIIIPFDRKADEVPADKKDFISKPPGTVSQATENKENAKKDDLTEQVNKLEIPPAGNVELKVFQKLLVDESEKEKQNTELTLSKPSFEESIREPGKSDIESGVVISQDEPHSLNEALEGLQTSGSSKHLDSVITKEPASFNEIFVNKEPRYGAKPQPKKNKVKKINGFLKVLFYLFLITMFGVMCFYIYKIIFDQSNSKGRIENIRKPGADTLNKQFASDENVKGESIQVERFNGVVYRKLGLYFYIEYNLFQSINEASDKEAKLKSNMISCRVEAVMTVDNTIEYRILIGPFETLDKAKEYQEEYKSILDSVN